VGCTPTRVSVKKPEKFKTVVCSSVEKKEGTTYPKNLTNNFIKGNGKKVYAFTDWYDLGPRTKNTVRWEWYDPKGEISGSSAREIMPKSSHWKTWGYLKLDDKYNRSPGLWTVKVFFNDHYICAEEFTISDE
jgi:hypothetical protein